MRDELILDVRGAAYQRAQLWEIFLPDNFVWEYPSVCDWHKEHSFPPHCVVSTM